MAFETFIAQVSKGTQPTAATATAFAQPATEGLQRLSEALLRADAKLDTREELRLRKLLAFVNLENIRQACAEGRASQLSAREQRAVVSGFALLGPEAVEAGIRALPALRGLYVRRLFRQWGGGTQGAHWDRFVDFLGAVGSADAPVQGLPLDAAELLRVSGPSALVDRLPDLNLEAFEQRLREAGVKRRWVWWRSALLAWFVQHRGRGAELTSGVDWVLRTADARLQLLPRVQGEDTSVSTDPRLQAHFVAELLLARAAGTLAPESVDPIEARFLSSGSEVREPRLEISRRWWDLVKERQPAAYEAFLGRLGPL